MMQTALTHPVPSTIHRWRWATVLTAMAAAVAAWTVANPLLDIDVLVEVGSGPARQVSHLAVTLTSLFAGLAAWALLAFLEQRTPKARTVWTVVASVVFLVSLAGPFGAVTLESTVVLLVLHVVVAAILIAGLPRAGTTRR